MDRADFMPPPAAVEQIARDLAVYEPERRRAAARVARLLPTVMVAYAVAVVSLGWIVLPLIWEPGDLRLTLGAVVAVGLAGYGLYQLATKPARDTQQWLRDRILPVAFSYLDDVRYRHAWRPDFIDRLPEELVGRYDTASFEDVVSGRFGDARFEIAEAHLERRSGKSNVTVFQGLILAFDLDQAFPGRLVVVRRSGEIARFFQTIFGSNDLTDVDLNKPYLDDYHIRADDADAARALFETGLAEALAWVRATWPGEPARMALRRSDGFLLLPTGTRTFFELPGIERPLDYRADIEPIANQMADLLVTAARVRAACGGRPNA